MEQVLKKILNVLNELKSDVNELKSDVNELKSDVNTSKTEQVKVNERLTRLEYKVDKLEIGQKEIKENLNGFQDEYTETIQNVSVKIDNVDLNIETFKSDLLAVQAVTGKNMADIAHLKAIK